MRGMSKRPKKQKANRPDTSWLPNWRNENEYPGSDEPARRWQWEFLRRNAEFQQDIDRLYEAVEKGRWLSPGELSDFKSSRADAKDLESVIEVSGSFSRRFLLVWGICWAQDYRCGDPPDTPALPNTTTTPGYWQDTDQLLSDIAKFPELAEPRYRFLSVDLSIPIDEQMAVWRSELVREQQALRNSRDIPPEQPTTKKRNPDIYRTYLRILDARTTGVKFREIGEVVYPTDADPDAREAKVKKASKAAMLLTTPGPKGYKSIL